MLLAGLCRRQRAPHRWPVESSTPSELGALLKVSQTNRERRTMVSAETKRYPEELEEDASPTTTKLWDRRASPSKGTEKISVPSAEGPENNSSGPPFPYSQQTGSKNE